ncbi:hypothetical protein AGMMS50293_28420 [Spirochaetia bacterium]|nr:hypothetical protein AGMMS50293_28420 [Spirochaetia bacterium]
MENINLLLKPINELLKETFLIPSYQRGYRWRPEQVKELLDDIWKYRKDCESASQKGKPSPPYYCLQPIVVSYRKNENCWEVLDGQQRLTTIYIILYELKDILKLIQKESFSIRYDTRIGNDEFLNVIDLDQKYIDIDYYFICCALEAVKLWFKGKNGTDRFNFISTLLNDNETGKNVQVIWYDVTEENKSNKYAVDIFTRLNIGKIALTNSELIKALFLQKDNFNENKLSLNQLQIASEWDIIENKLQNDDYWLFLYNLDNEFKYENHIEYIFDLFKNKTIDSEFYYTFHEFYQNDFSKINSLEIKNSSVSNLWYEIKKYFLTFDEWYNNSELYHLTGFLIDSDKEKVNIIKQLKKQSGLLSKEEFKVYLKREITKIVKCSSIESLEYKPDYTKIKEILLLFNLQTILSAKKSDMYFPFFRYKNDSWDLEHVRSQTDKPIVGNNRKPWLIDILGYFTGIEGYNTPEEKKAQIIEINKINNDKEKIYCDRIIQLLDSAKISDKDFSSLYEDIIVEFKESDMPDNIDSICNLALLDSSTNRSYKNAMFPIKRKRIIKNDMTGIFVPICTKNVFYKSYSKRMGEVMYWNSNDANDYIESIKLMLKEYLPNTGVKNAR